LLVEKFNKTKEDIIDWDLQQAYRISKKRTQRELTKLKECCENESFPTEKSVICIGKKEASAILSEAES
jgi:hypothetical protein